jgi:hypothetical protein
MVDVPTAIWPHWGRIATGLMVSTALSREGPVTLVVPRSLNLVRHSAILRSKQALLIHLHMEGIRNTLKTTLAIHRTCFNMVHHSMHHRCMVALAHSVLEQAQSFLMVALQPSLYRAVLVILQRSMHHIWFPIVQLAA